MLKEWDEDEELQLAGLFHSIYGTEGFQDFQLSFDRRDDIKKLIGEVTGSKPYWTYREHCIRNRLVYAYSCTAHMPSSFWAPRIFAVLKALCSVSGESDKYYTHTCSLTDLTSPDMCAAGGVLRLLQLCHGPHHAWMPRSQTALASTASERGPMWPEGRTSPSVTPSSVTSSLSTWQTG